MSARLKKKNKNNTKEHYWFAVFEWVFDKSVLLYYVAVVQEKRKRNWIRMLTYKVDCLEFPLENTEHKNAGIGGSIELVILTVLSKEDDFPKCKTNGGVEVSD